MTALKATAAAFFTFWFIIYLATFVMTAFFRMIGAAFPNFDAASKVSGFAIGAYVTYTGYQIAKPEMHPWLGWIYWINPLGKLSARAFVLVHIRASSNAQQPTVSMLFCQTSSRTRRYHAQMRTWSPIFFRNIRIQAIKLVLESADLYRLRLRSMVMLICPAYHTRRRISGATLASSSPGGSCS